MPNTLTPLFRAPPAAPPARARVRRGASDPGAGLRLIWERDGRDWPHRERSRFITAAAIRWHVQIAGEGPVLLMVHGTGASTHSWQGLLPLLARHFTVVAADLPGHGFTTRPAADRLSLPGMAWGVSELLRALALAPALAVGHSAGAAILCRMCLDGAIAPKALVSLNGALLPLAGLPGHFFAPLAKALVSIPIVPVMFAWRATNRATVARLLRGTGSVLPPSSLALYQRLLQSPGHVAAALGMMARWDLAPLVRDLPRLPTPIFLVVGSNDRAIPPSEADRLCRLLPHARKIALPGLGHLAHEERPDLIAAVIERIAHDHGLPAS
ncbi:MAG: alpha/beta fold hydrolase BchO [Acidibrevibacterium sp.]|uniref:alpha/beta fold hydrolase BchO n=1 Tax=Acidibrevibacterium sp. TaxID=2606776 RepID=UPI003D069C26